MQNTFAERFIKYVNDLGLRIDENGNGDTFLASFQFSELDGVVIVMFGWDQPNSPEEAAAIEYMTKNPAYSMLITGVLVSMMNDHGYRMHTVLNQPEDADELDGPHNPHGVQMLFVKK